MVQKKQPLGSDRPSRTSLHQSPRANVGGDFVSIYVGDNLKDQQLPLSMTKAFQHWILHDGKLQGIYNSESTGGEDGWVDPLAYDEAWLADDLPAPVLRPAIGALVKGGELRYIMPGVEMTVQCGGKLWWNRGVKTFPLAQRWMDIRSMDITTLSLCAFGQDGYETAKESVSELDEDGNPKTFDDAGAWKELWAASPKDALLSLVETLAGEAGQRVASGFHVLVIPLPQEPLRQAPAPGTRLKVVLAQPDDQPTTELLDFQSSQASATPVSGSEMDVLFRAAAAGGTSEYLPKVYKELYSGMLQ